MSCQIEGPADYQIEQIATLEEAGPADLSFLSNSRYERLLGATRAGAVIVSDKQPIPAGMRALRVPDPYAAFCVLMVRLYGNRRHGAAGIDARSVIDPTAILGENATIRHGVTIGAEVVIGRNAVVYPGCHISERCRIGDDCVLYPNVVIYEGCILGHRVTIHAGTVIGEDGLGYAPLGDKWHKIPQIGAVEIGDDVEIGANCTIDRATLGKTVIASGSKLSNLIAIGHGTKVGRDCMFVAQVGIAGSVTVGNHVTMAGKVGIAGHLTIGDNAQIAAMSGVMRDVPANMRMLGLPAQEMTEAARCMSLVMKLPEMRRRIQALEKKIAELSRESEPSAPSS